jgi:hypothetical protein
MFGNCADAGDVASAAANISNVMIVGRVISRLR